MEAEGRNHLVIRGPENVINTIQATGAALTEGDAEILQIARDYFGPDKVEVIDRTERCIFLVYEYRGFTVYRYLEKLLEKYPQCWIQNNLTADNGDTGMWIGRNRGRTPEIQVRAWKQITRQEEYYTEDYSK